MLAPQVRGAKVKAGGAGLGGAKGGKGKGGVIQKVVLDVETDTNILLSQVCGANYVLGSDPVLIKVMVTMESEMKANLRRTANTLTGCGPWM